MINQVSGWLVDQVFPVLHVAVVDIPHVQVHRPRGRNFVVKFIHGQREEEEALSGRKRTNHVATSSCLASGE